MEGSTVSVARGSSQVPDARVIMALQRQAGNRAVTEVLQRMGCAGGCHCGGACAGVSEEEPAVPEQRASLVLQRECVDGKWKYEYDGCSLPPGYVKYLRSMYGTFDQNNPAGGEDTKFAHSKSTLQGGGPCDRHDECYQSCTTKKDSCDQRMHKDMMEVCAASRENQVVKERCVAMAYMYFNGLRAFAEGAFKDRKGQVCSCDPKLQPPHTRFPPPALLERKGKPMGWLDYLIERGRPPLSAYKTFLSEEEFRRYLKGAPGTGFSEDEAYRELIENEARRIGGKRDRLKMR